ncbi:MAG TPA: helix-turn-helix domain containing protein [Amycolatopsis sp.]|uniref:helix-turn-helix domain containing protein n=1 Tax=Amycolatopsis sp. TaxID=37632 RepID=UPI002B46018B|nr:helix-turn-helix domain containing protein [Amycolatopsis sp.]HKS43857.1 helix-turn-helix domain containing protein [Amycolatopsis sp.]
MTIIEEHRSKLRSGDNTFSIEVTTLPGGDRPGRLVVQVDASGPAGEPVADGRIEVAQDVVGALGAVLAETLRHHQAMAGAGGRRARDRPACRGRPWTPELDAELERRWIAGESVEEIAARFERTPGGIRARLPRVGCDPERPGEYLPEPPSHREAAASP